MSTTAAQPDSTQSPASKINAQCLLYSGIKNLLRCDEAEVVEGIAHYVTSQYRTIRVVSRFVELTKHTPIPALLTLLAWARSFLSVTSADRVTGLVWIARLSNERRAIESLMESRRSLTQRRNGAAKDAAPLRRCVENTFLAPELPWTELKFQSRISIRAAVRLAWQNRSEVRRVYKLGRRMHLRFESFKVMRLMELLGYYGRYVDLFGQAHFDIALTSNHSNPHGIAFNLAARKRGVPVVLISHGMPVRPVARLKYALAVVHSEAASETYLEEGCEIERVLIHGRKQDHLPMHAGPLPQKISVGIFLCKDVNEQRFTTLVENLLANDRVARIIVRPHPKNLWRNIHSWIASHEDGRLSRSCGQMVLDDLKGLDIVFGGNSSVLVDSVSAGIPSAYVDNLDHGSPDMHRFVATGLIYRSEVNPDLDQIYRFYERPDWPQTLRKFANIDEDESVVLAEALKVMTTALSPEPSRTTPAAPATGRPQSTDKISTRMNRCG